MSSTKKNPSKPVHKPQLDLLFTTSYPSKKELSYISSVDNSRDDTAIMSPTTLNSINLQSLKVPKLDMTKVHKLREEEETKLDKKKE